MSCTEKAETSDAGGSAMSYAEKSTWVYGVVSLLVWAGYVAVVLSRADGGPLTQVAYVGPLLWAVGLSILANTLVRTLVEAVRPSETSLSDERDQDIERRGEHVAGIVLGVAFVGPFALALSEAPHFWIAQAIYTAYTLSAVTGSAVKATAYRRGR